MRSAVITDRAIKIDFSDLGFLQDARWEVVDRDAVEAILRPILIGLPDETLIEAFHNCFINDFCLKKTAPNTFRLTWNEYDGEFVGYNDHSGHQPLNNSPWSGWNLIDFILKGYEKPANLCLVFNIWVERFPRADLVKRVIMPTKEREKFLMVTFH